MKADVSTDGDATRKEAEEALAAGEARMHALLEAAGDGIISIDGRDAIQTINPAAEQLFGYVADEVIGRNVKILMPPPYREEHDSYIARYLATGEKKEEDHRDRPRSVQFEEGRHDLPHGPIRGRSPSGRRADLPRDRPRYHRAEAGRGAVPVGCRISAQVAAKTSSCAVERLFIKGDEALRSHRYLFFHAPRAGNTFLHENLEFLADH